MTVDVYQSAVRVFEKYLIQWLPQQWMIGKLKKPCIIISD